MPQPLTYPGVYLQEIPSEVRTITGVATAETAFLDFFPRGPLRTPVRITSFTEFSRVFGGLDTRSEASYALAQYYLNGGQVAWIVRLAVGNPVVASAPLAGNDAAKPAMTVKARDPGTWGNDVRVAVVANPVANRFDLFVQETAADHKTVLTAEVHRNLSAEPGSSRFAADVIESASALVQLSDITGVPKGAAAGTVPPADTAFVFLGDAKTANAVVGTDGEAFQDGKPRSQAFADAILGTKGSSPVPAALFELDRIDPFSFALLCLPVAARLDKAIMSTVLQQVLKYCEDKRAFLLVDIPADVTTEPQMIAWTTDNSALRSKNAAVYFPRLQMSDALAEGRPRTVGPSGTMAGLFARTDAERGVWKAPAGTAAVLRGAVPAVAVTDAEQGALNPLAVNAFRTFPVFGAVCWGARTLDGTDQRASEWKYIPVRRTALFIEESLVRGLAWVVFEPNDEPLWAQIRLNVGSFLGDLFRRGAFAGRSPREAYFVKCDRETTTQADIDRGLVNVVVGFAAVEPAEFLVLQIQQIAGQLTT